MTPELFKAVSLNLGKHEGRVLAIYADSKSIPTCGVGHALIAPGDAYNICFWKDTATLANRDEINAAWSAVRYKQLKRALMMSYEESDRLLESDLRRFERIMAETFPAHEAYPESAQVALYDICFNTGSFSHWPHLVAAVKSLDWQTAAKESNRPEVGKERNEETYSQFANIVV